MLVSEPEARKECGESVEKSSDQQSEHVSAQKFEARLAAKIGLLKQRNAATKKSQNGASASENLRALAFGFADSKGAPCANLGLSQERPDSLLRVWNQVHVSGAPLAETVARGEHAN